MSTAKQRIGKWGEDLSASYLTGRGYTVVERNVRTPYGEIDLVATQGETTVFIEVKTRTNTSFGMPEMAISARKQAHMLAAAEAYLQIHPEINEWRIDVIAIRGHPNDPDPEIILFENALS